MTDLENAIEAYLIRGFGYMNKNDFEVWIFNELLKTKLAGLSNYAISVRLKLPEQKVKRLKYEATLKYGKTEDEQEYAKQFETILKKAKFKKGGGAIQLVIEDIQLRKYLDSILKEDGRFSDSSFNSEIANIEIDDFKALLDKIWSKNQWKAFNDEMNKQINGTTFVDFLKKVGKNTAEKSGNKVIDLTLNGIIKLLPTVLALV